MVALNDVSILGRGRLARPRRPRPAAPNHAILREYIYSSTQQRRITLTLLLNVAMQLCFGSLLTALLASNGVSSHSAAALPAESTVPAGYSAVATRANGARPIISSHDAGSGAGFNTARSTFTFNFNPTLLTLPDGTQALLIRSSNGTNASTASTKTNPDYLTLAKIRSTGAGAIVVDDLSDASIVVRPEASAIENRGVQDPRVMRDPTTGTYWLAISTYGDKGVGLAIARSKDGYTWETVKYCASAADGCGKSATILYHNDSHHYMFWGPGSVNVAVSSDYMNWTTLNSTAAFGLYIMKTASFRF